MGELARYYNATRHIGAQLVVVPMRGWRRALWLDETGLPWVKTSPNITRFETAIHYPGTVFFEATNVAEGRGSDLPFEQVGAPWLDNRALVESLAALKLPGVRFEPLDFPISAHAGKYPGQIVHGVRFVVTDRAHYRPLRTSLLAIDLIRRLHPADFRWLLPDLWDGRSWGALERHAGTDRLRQAFEQGTIRQLLNQWDGEAEHFRTLRQPYLLYR